MLTRVAWLQFGLGALLSGAAPANAQPAAPPRYRNLIMEGGGIRGIAYGGALRELEERGVLRGIERVGGTSAGAIQAALLAVGYSASEVIAVLHATPVQRLNDGRFIFFGGSHRLLKQYGWYRGDQLTAYLRTLGPPNPAARPDPGRAAHPGPAAARPLPRPLHHRYQPHHPAHPGIQL